MFKVVLVDDEVYARQGLRQFTDWNKYGFDIVAEATNGEEALRIIELTQPDLVVTDIRMPVLDGLGLIQAVKELKRAEPSFIIVSGYNDFKYAQQAMRFGVKDFILKPIDELEMERMLQSLSQNLSSSLQFQADQAHVLSQSIFERLVTGMLDTALSPDMKQTLSLREGDEFRYFEVELNDLHFVPGGSEGCLKKNAAAAIAAALGQEVYIYERQRGIFGFITGRSSWKRGERSWKLFSVLLQQRLRDHLGANAALYGGKAVKESDIVHESYRTAVEAAAYKYALPSGEPLLYEEIADRPLKHMEMNEGVFTSLMETVEEHEQVVALRLIDEMFASFQTEYYAHDAVVMSMTRYVFGVVRIIENMQGEKNELKTLEFMLTWSQMPTSSHGLKAIFIGFIEESSGYIAALQKKNTKGSIQKIKQYIEKHYDRSISLKSIAATFYMNPVYLGQLFKKTFGVYFNEFLLQTRIQEAKRLLRQTELRVYEIADKVGFNNADYFVTQFEKVERKSPSEYRSALYAKK